MKNADLKKRILDISYKFKLSHIGSCLTAVDILDDIYRVKKKQQPFILSNGHAGVALYVVLEKWEGKSAVDLFKKHGVHPNRDIQNGIWCSTGSLGQGLSIGLGMAITGKKVYCLTSDGEWMEGSMWESLRIAGEQQLKNLHIYVNANGFSAYNKVNLDLLEKRIKAFQVNGLPHIYFIRTSNQLPFLKGLEGHYHVLTEKTYTAGLRLLNTPLPPKKTLE